jgi:putative redox protein
VKAVIGERFQATATSMGFIVAMRLLHCNNETMGRVESLSARVTQSTMPAATENRFTTMECTIDWLSASGMAFIAETGSGHLLTMDGAPDGGGRNLAPRPMETVLAGTAACSAYDVVLVLKRGRHDVRGCRVKVTSERAPTDPKVFTQIHLHFVVTGRSLPAAAVERAIALSHEKYCSATIMLGKTAEITTSFECIEG